MLCFHLTEAVKFNVILCQNFLSGVTKIGKIIGVNSIWQFIYFLLCGLICLDFIRNRNKLIGIRFPSSILFLSHGKCSQVFPIFSTGYDAGISLQDWFCQLCVGMSADDQINVRNILCKDFVLWYFFVLPCSAVWYTGDHVYIFVLFYFLYCFSGCFWRVFEKKLAGRSAIQRILAENTQYCNLYITFLNYRIVFYSICLKCFINLFLTFTETGFFHCIPVHITHNHPGKVFAWTDCGV